MAPAKVDRPKAALWGPRKTSTLSMPGELHGALGADQGHAIDE